MRSVTFGQYICGNSFMHKATPNTKLIVTFIYIFILFFLNNILPYVFTFFVVMLLYRICKIPFKMAVKNIKSIAILLIFTSLINLFFSSKGEVLFEFLFLRITKESLFITVLILVRLFLLMIGVSILTYTTLPLDLARSLGNLFLPLKRFKFPVEEVSIMLSISIRFVPLLISEIEKITIAQKSRGADIKGKGIKKKMRFIVSILVPLLISSFKRADELAVAMESRCYLIGAKRTRYITFKFGRNDLYLIFGAVFLFISMFIFNSFNFWRNF